MSVKNHKKTTNARVLKTIFAYVNGNCHFLSVAICAVCRPWEALFIGAIGGAVAVGGTVMEERLGIDDPVGAFPTHALASVWGLIATGLFCERTPQFAEYSGLFKNGGWTFFGIQILATVCITMWASTTTFLQLYIIDKIFGLRMTDEEEEIGADYYVHNICSEETKPVTQNECQHGGSEDGQVISSADVYNGDAMIRENPVMKYSPVDMENLQEINSRSSSGKRKIIINNNEISLKVTPYLERQITLPKERNNCGYHSN